MLAVAVVVFKVEMLLLGQEARRDKAGMAVEGTAITVPVMHRMELLIVAAAEVELVGTTIRVAPVVRVLSSSVIQPEH